LIIGEIFSRQKGETMKHFKTINFEIDVTDEMIKIIKDNIIPGSVTRKNGYAHKDISCKFKKNPKLMKIDEKIILGYFDDFGFNFGTRGVSLTESTEHYSFRGTFYTD